jgi:SPP1 family predicted phage head-tail adaptor
MISAGKRDRRVTILRRQETRGPAGDVVVTYAQRCRVWAALSGWKGREAYASQQDIPAWELRASILFRQDVSASDKVEVDGKRYDIVHVAEVGRREGLDLLLAKDLE